MRCGYSATKIIYKHLKPVDMHQTPLPMHRSLAKKNIIKSGHTIPPLFHRLDHRKAATPATIPMPIPAALAIAVGCAAAPLLLELEDAVPEGVELAEGVGEGLWEPDGRVVLELWEEEAELEEGVEEGGVETEEGGVAEEADDGLVVADPVTSGRICAGVLVLLFVSVLAEGAGDGLAPAFWIMLACAA